MTIRGKVRLQPLKWVILTISEVGMDMHVVGSPENQLGNEVHVQAGDEPFAVSNHSTHTPITMFEVPS